MGKQKRSPPRPTAILIVFINPFTIDEESSPHAVHKPSMGSKPIGSFLPSYLELADLNVHGEGVELHWADEGDPGGERVHQRVVPVDPDALKLAQHRMGLKGLET